MPFLTANGISIYHELHGPRTGDGGERVLNITGTGGDLRESYPDLSPLNAHFTVAHYDQRGLGQTDKPVETVEMADYADDAAGLIDELGWDRCHVVGTSFGGMVAQHLAIRHPHLVDRLVLNCTSPGGSQPSFPLHTIQALDVEARTELMLGLFDNRWDPGQPEPIPGLGAIYDVMVARTRDQRVGESLRGYQSQLDARSRHDVEAALGEIRSPTLVCGGEFDDLAPPRNVAALRDGIPKAMLRMFNGGHLFLMQDDTAFPTIISFLQGDLEPLSMNSDDHGAEVIHLD